MRETAINIEKSPKGKQNRWPNKAEDMLLECMTLALEGQFLAQQAEEALLRQDTDEGLRITALIREKTERMIKLLESLDPK